MLLRNVLALAPILLAFLSATSNAYNILFVPMHLTGSHKKSMVPLANFLAENGHKITIWNAFFEKIPINSKMVTDIDILLDTDNKLYLEQFVWKNGSSLMDAWNSKEMKPYDVLIPWWLDIDICKHAIDQRMDAINDISYQKWDLIVIDLFFAPCGYVIAELANAPYVLLSTSNIFPSSARHMRLPVPVSSALNNLADFDVRRFVDRVSYIFFWEIVDEVCAGVLSQLMKRTLTPPLSPEFTYANFDKGSDMCISSYPSMWEWPRPYLADLVPVGGLACRSPKPLPTEYLDFVSDPKSKGTILAAFGHVVSWATTKNETIYEIYEAFKQLSKYRVIWQYNGPPLPPLPNVKMSDWIPQTEILYHPKTKTFISHMGLKSAIEGVCAKVPFVALPVYAEQPLNTQLLISRLKLGSYLDKWALKSDTIVRQILAVVENDAYKQRITKLAAMMADSPVSPTEVAGHKIQFLIRHYRNIKILKHKGRELNFLKRWMIDVIVISCWVLIVTTILIVSVVSWLLRLVR